MCSITLMAFIMLCNNVVLTTSIHCTRIYMDSSRQDGVRISLLIVIQVPAQIINMVERAKILNSELYRPGSCSSLQGYNIPSSSFTRFLFRFQGSSFASVLLFNSKARASTRNKFLSQMFLFSTRNELSDCERLERVWNVVLPYFPWPS